MLAAVKWPAKGMCMSVRHRRVTSMSRAIRSIEHRRRKLRGSIYRRILLDGAGPGLYVGSGVTVVGGEAIRLGEDVSLGTLVDLNSEVRENDQRGQIDIGNRVSVGDGSVLSAADLIRIDDDVVISLRVLITDHQHAIADRHTAIARQGIDRIAPVHVEEGAWIGVGAVILQGVTVGRNAVIGANSVVTSSVPDYAVAVGAPAVVTRR